MPRIDPSPGQESVWDYPRPPRIEPCARRIRVEFAGETIADSIRTYRLLETSHPPVYYIPREDVRTGWLRPGSRQTFCEFKGLASLFDLQVGARVSREAAWSYPSPAPPYSILCGCLSFYAGRVDACFVDDERVQPQEGDFYGGWITSNIVGPFKGGVGTTGW